MTDERFTALPTAEEYALFREAYAETYPVRPLLNAVDAKDAEIEQLRSVALAARALVQSAHDSFNHDGYETSVVDEPALTRLEKALADAGLDLTEEEFERGVVGETPTCTCAMNLGPNAHKNPDCPVHAEALQSQVEGLRAEVDRLRAREAELLAHVDDVMDKVRQRL